MLNSASGSLIYIYTAITECLLVNLPYMQLLESTNITEYFPPNRYPLYVQVRLTSLDRNIIKLFLCIIRYEPTISMFREIGIKLLLFVSGYCSP